MQSILAKVNGFRLLIVCMAVPLASNTSLALDRGHELLLRYGYQVHASPSPRIIPEGGASHDQINLSIWRDANFTGMHFANLSWNKQMVTEPAGNYQWQRWWDYDATKPLTAEVNQFPAKPAEPGMIMASVGEELDLTIDATVEAMKDRLEILRTTAPAVIGYISDWGGLMREDPIQPHANTLDELKSYMRRAQPDMLCFNLYPFGFGSNWEGGSPTILYDAMGRYRMAALAGNTGDGTVPIPYGMWINYGKSIAQNPPAAPISESEMNLQYGAAWAYGYTSLIGFRYSNESPNAKEHTQSTLFATGFDDSGPTSLFGVVARLNQHCRNLGPALIRLRSVNLSFVRGRHKNAAGTDVANVLPQYANEWAARENGDPYLTAIQVTNSGNPDTAAKVNAGLPGDVIVGHFKVLDESFDGPAANQLYFVVTNGLTNLNGNGPDTRQRIVLTFDFGKSGIHNLQRLNKDTGKVEIVPLVPVTPDGIYRLEMHLSGGEGDLFKYNTGAPFARQPHPVQHDQ